MMGLLGWTISKYKMLIYSPSPERFHFPSSESTTPLRETALTSRLPAYCDLVSLRSLMAAELDAETTRHKIREQLSCRKNGGRYGILDARRLHHDLPHVQTHPIPLLSRYCPQASMSSGLE
jgi:hypothetical protein